MRFWFYLFILIQDTQTKIKWAVVAPRKTFRFRKGLRLQSHSLLQERRRLRRLRQQIRRASLLRFRWKSRTLLHLFRRSHKLWLPRKLDSQMNLLKLVLWLTTLVTSVRVCKNAKMVLLSLQMSSFHQATKLCMKISAKAYQKTLKTGTASSGSE